MDRSTKAGSQGNSPTVKRVVRPADDFFAQSIMGQYVYANPAKELILVRLGRKDNFNWAALGLSMAKKM